MVRGMLTIGEHIRPHGVVTAHTNNFAARIGCQIEFGRHGNRLQEAVSGANSVLESSVLSALPFFDPVASGREACRFGDPDDTGRKERKINKPKDHFVFSF